MSVRAPLYDCTSCPAFKTFITDQPKLGGACHFNPPLPYPVAVDKLGRPQTLSFWPQVGPGDYCLQHPLAKALSNAGPRPFAITVGGASEPIPNGEAKPRDGIDDSGDPPDGIQEPAPAPGQA